MTKDEDPKEEGLTTNEQIKLFYNFFEKHYQAEILETVRKGQNFLIVDFSLLSKFDPRLAEITIEEPEELHKAAEMAIKEFDLPKKVKHFFVRFQNIPKSQKILIRDIRSKHLDKLLWMEGVVRQKSDVRPQVVEAKFECPSCGNVITVVQVDKKFKKPSRCSCGRKGKFKQLEKELIDAQGLVLEESPEDLEGSDQPKRINILLKNDLVSPLKERRTNPGSKIKVVGYVKEVPVTLRSGGKSTKFDLLVEGNYVEPVDEDFSNIDVTKEEEEEIKKISQQPKVYEKLIQSMAPSIYGYKRIKEAILLQMVGGCKKERGDGVISRGDTHILLIGDPGCGKSQLLKRSSKVAPKARYVTGKGVSGAGLTASVVKDEFLGGWSLEAGALVLANKGFVMIDELDKMSTEDRSAMHEALEQQTVSISKANIQATLHAETTVLAAANPKLGRFDPYNPPSQQINLPPTLVNRFDLIFPVKDLPDKKRDKKLAKHILGLHKDPKKHQPVIETDLLRKYLSYCRQHDPELSKSAVNEIQKYYIEMRGKGASEEGVSTIPITVRQLEALVRLAEATAKLRLAKTVKKKDAKRAIELIDFCLNQVARDVETGKIDIDRISTGISASERGKARTVKKIITELEENFGKEIPIKEIVSAANEQDISDSQVEEILEKLKRSGDIFEPRNGYIQKIS